MNRNTNSNISRRNLKFLSNSVLKGRVRFTVLLVLMCIDPPHPLRGHPSGGGDFWSAREFGVFVKKSILFLEKWTQLLGTRGAAWHSAGLSEKSRERLVKGVKKTACLSVASLQFLAFCVWANRSLFENTKPVKMYPLVREIFNYFILKKQLFLWFEKSWFQESLHKKSGSFYFLKTAAWKGLLFIG